MLVSVHVVGFAATPLKVIVLDPGVTPKLLPTTVTGVAAPPMFGVTLSIFGVAVKVAELLGKPLTVITTGPVAAGGSGAEILVVLQLVGVDAIPLKLTVLDP
jgi:hypothetical protein